MLDQLPQFAIIAHRGASQHAPENTLAAFRLALRQEADAVELDVMLNGDGEVMVFHDHTLDRTTNGSGRLVDKTLKELRQLDAGSSFDKSFAGERISTLGEVFEAIGQETFINVELKNGFSFTDNLPAKVAAQVQDHDMQERVWFASFNPFVLFRIQRLMPEIPIGLLTIGGGLGSFTRLVFGSLLSHQSLHPHRGDVSEKLLASAQRKGRRLYTYTVNQAQDMTDLFNLGVDGIFTDDPMLANQVRGEHTAGQESTE